MSQILSSAVKRDLENGDRIRIQQGQRPIPELIGRVGMIVELFRLPAGSCLVLIDGDLDRREWFFYQDEVALA
jgi:hypothetical protein